MYIRVRDCFNRPICSVPGGEIDLVDRQSYDWNWTFRYFQVEKERGPGNGVARAINLAHSIHPCSLKVVANEDTLLLMMFLGWANERDTKHLFCVHAAQTEKHLLRTQNVSDKYQKRFCLSDTNFVSATNVACTGKWGNICVRNNVSATLCPRLPPPLLALIWCFGVGVTLN